MSLSGGGFEHNRLLKAVDGIRSMPGLGQKHTQCRIGIRVAGINLDGRAKLLFSVPEGSLLRQEQSEVDTDLAVLRIVFYGLLKQRCRICILALLAVKHPEVALRLGECGASLQCFLEACLCLGLLSGA